TSSAGPGWYVLVASGPWQEPVTASATPGLFDRGVASGLADTASGVWSVVRSGSFDRAGAGNRGESASDPSGEAPGGEGGHETPGSGSDMVNAPSQRHDAGVRQLNVTSRADDRATVNIPSRAQLRQEEDAVLPDPYHLLRISGFSFSVSCLSCVSWLL